MRIVLKKLNQITQKLKDRHKDGKYSHFSDTQFHCWGNTIQLGRHKSYDDPPNKAFFGGGSKASASASPGKRIHLRSQCIDQLTKWHKLMEEGAISEEEYEDMHSTILSDIKKF